MNSDNSYFRDISEILILQEVCKFPQLANCLISGYKTGLSQCSSVTVRWHCMCFSLSPF